MGKLGSCVYVSCINVPLLARPRGRYSLSVPKQHHRGVNKNYWLVLFPTSNLYCARPWFRCLLIAVRRVLASHQLRPQTTLRVNRIATSYKNYGPISSTLPAHKRVAVCIEWKKYVYIHDKHIHIYADFRSAEELIFQLLVRHDDRGDLVLYLCPCNATSHMHTHGPYH